MKVNAIGKHLHHHAKLYHHRITSHPHYELMAGHSVELLSIVAAFFVAISF
jgi:hypothetical protein